MTNELILCLISAAFVLSVLYVGAVVRDRAERKAFKSNPLFIEDERSYEH